MLVPSWQTRQCCQRQSQSASRCVCSDANEHRRRLDERVGRGLPVGWIDSWVRFQQYLRSDDNQGNYPVPYPLIRVDTALPVDLNVLKEWVSRAGVELPDA